MYHRSIHDTVYIQSDTQCIARQYTVYTQRYTVYTQRYTMYAQYIHAENTNLHRSSHYVISPV